MAVFSFHAAVQKFSENLSNCRSDGYANDSMNAVWTSLDGSESEKRNALDQAFREFLTIKLKETGIFNYSDEEIENDRVTTNGVSEKENHGISDIEKFISFVILHAQEKKCSSSLPILLLADIFDTITLDKCEHLFDFVEKNVDIWNKEPFFNSGKNHLLRMCNVILRRLSKSLNTIFCGRIQLFLARLFPIEEKSALNIMSQFHSENVTIYKKNIEDFKLEDIDEDADDGEVIETTSPVDFALYTRFWSVQDFFRNPTNCYVMKSWKLFQKDVTEILKVFGTYKIEYNEKQRKDSASANEQMNDIMKNTLQSHERFPKYLTNEKLLNLQINDSNFRRYFLVQILILCQYLTGHVKFKHSTYKLSDSQTAWVKETVELVYRIMKETPPRGEEFAACVKHILTREENWINWKNEGCQSFAKAANKEPAKPIVVKEATPKGRRTKPRPPKRSVGEEFLSGGNNKRINMGTVELTRLWNLCPDNMEACKAENRLKFLPSINTFFEEAIEQADPDAGIEEEYKVVNDPNFQWRALRLLASRSNYFFTPSTNPFKALPQYLSTIIDQLAIDLGKPTVTTNEDMKTEQVD